MLTSNQGRVGIRFILHSGQAVVRSFSESDARKVIDSFVKRSTEFLSFALDAPGVDQSNINSLWAVRASSIDFIDVVDIQEMQQQSMKQHQPRSGGVVSW